MNILKRLPDDLQEMVYLKLYKINMNSIKNELEDKLNDRWNKLDNNDKRCYLFDYYYSETNYNLYNLNRPDKVFYEGYCKVIEYDEDLNIEYSSSILYNPTYGDMLLEADKIVDIKNDDYYGSLDAIGFWSENIIDEVYGEIKAIKLYLSIND